MSRIERRIAGRTRLKKANAGQISRRAAQLFVVGLSTLVLSMASAYAADPDTSAPASSTTPLGVAAPFTLDDPAAVQPPAELQDPTTLPGIAPTPVSDNTPLSGIVDAALGMIGIPYRWGGNTPQQGLDCSGFVRFVYQQVAKVALPRESAQISKAGSKVAQSDLHPGDLVFFNTRRGQATHVGIYMGNEQFIHAPTQGSHVRVDSMNNRYWAAHYYGARRVIG